MNKAVRQLLPFGSLILIVAVVSALAPNTFLTMENFMNVLRRSSVTGIVAVGMTAIIISAGIDLSVGSMMTLAGMAGAATMIGIGGENPVGMSLFVGTLAGMLVGLLCGLANGILITSLDLPPFIVTLGTMSAFRGIAYAWNDGQPFNVPAYSQLNSDVTPLWKSVGAGGQEVWHSLPIPVSVTIFAAIVLIAAFVLNYTRLGRHTYAIGSNRSAAFHAGIAVRRNLVAIYALTGLAVGVAAMITTARATSAQPSAGIGLELDIIAAVVIGGASMSGGRGTITGTIVGTLMISFLRNGCVHLGISPHIQLIVIGVIIIAAVAVDQVAARKARTA